MSSDSLKTSEKTCEYYGLSFNTKEEREEHIKLEHAEHKQPSGVA